MSHHQRTARLRSWFVPALCAGAMLVSVGCTDGTLATKPLNNVPGPSNNAPNNNPNNEPGVDMGPQEDMTVVDPKPLCVPMERYFVREVFSKVAASQCQGCHNPQGIAGSSELVLHYSDGYSDHIERNMESMTLVATQRIQKHGYRSKLLLMPTAVLDHPGGKIFDEDSSSYKILEEFVRRVEMEDTCKDTNDDDFFKDLSYLERTDLIRKASLSLAGRLPTDQELMSVANNDDAAFDALLDALMTEEGFYDRMREGFNDIFLTDFYLRNPAENLLDNNHYPNRFWYDALMDTNEKNQARTRTRFGLAREPLELIIHVLKTGKPFTELLTADYTMVNPYSAKSYGVEDKVSFKDDTDQNEFVPVKLPATPNSIYEGEGFPHAGLLSSYIYLGRYPSTATNRNRARARVFYLHFLDTDVQELAPRGGDPTAIADTFNPILNSSQCNVCHYVVDPVAGAFQNFDNSGRYRPPSNGWFTDTFPPGFQSKSMAVSDFKSALKWLGQEAIGDRRFPQAMVAHAYYILMGRRPLKIPTDANAPDFDQQMRAYEVQHAWLKGLAERFVQNNYDFKLVLRELVKSPYYRIDHIKSPETLTPERLGEIKELGTAHLLTPTQLDRKLTAIFGEQWKINNRAVLLDTSYFRYLYGDIDSDQVTERLSEPNGLMGAIIRLMANDVACRMTAKDFKREPQERLLFVHNELTDLPGDADAEQRIKLTLQHLHQRILGEQLDVTEAELERSYQLFVEVQRDGKANIEAETLKVDLDSTCRSGDLTKDPDFTVRAWMAVITYMLQNYTFLYE